MQMTMLEYYMKQREIAQGRLELLDELIFIEEAKISAAKNTIVVVQEDEVLRK